MSDKQKQFYYEQGYMSIHDNPFNPNSAHQREKYYLFNAGVVDRLNGYEYDNKAFL